MKEIKIDSMQAHYTQFSKFLDKLSETDQKFTIWYLLEGYKAGLDDEINNAKEPKTVSEMYAHLKMCEMSKAIKDLRDVLLTEIF